MPEVVTVLLGLITVGITLVLAVVGWLAKQTYEIREMTNTLWQEWFGVDTNGSSGLKDDLEDDHESLREIVQETREENQESRDEVQRSFRTMTKYLRTMSRKLNSQDIEVPHPDEEITDSDMLNDD